MNVLRTQSVSIFLQNTQIRKNAYFTVKKSGKYLTRWSKLPSVMGGMETKLGLCSVPVRNAYITFFLQVLVK